MAKSVDRVLIVDDEPHSRASLREVVLAAGQVEVAETASGPEALLECQQQPPDLILLDLGLPELSGHDVLVALRAQGYRGPLIVMGDGQPPRAVGDALRLGATDFVRKPLRETEVLAAVERSLEAVRVYRERDALAARLRAADQALAAREARLTTLFEVGQTVTKMRDLKHLTAHVLRAAVTLTDADHAALYLRDEPSGQLILHAGENLSLSLLDRLGEAVEDPLAALVMASREPLIASEEGVRRANAARDLYAAVYAPLIVQGTVIGVLAVGNHLTRAPFDAQAGRLLAMLADYAAMGIVSTRLSQMLEQRAKTLESAYSELRTRDADRSQQLQRLLHQLHQPLVGVEADLIRLAQASARPGAGSQRDLLALRQRVRQLITQVTSLAERPG